MVTLPEISYVLLVYLLDVCYNAHTMVVMLNFVKAEIVVSHVWLLEDLEHLYRIQVLSRKFSSCFKSLDSPQDQLIFQPNTDKLIFLFPNPCCEHSNVLKETILLRSELVGACIA